MFNLEADCKCDKKIFDFIPPSYSYDKLLPLAYERKVERCHILKERGSILPEKKLKLC